ncbi:hypothetical protein EI42_06141 [Thermosporothrix hazakensis]|jgi:hypothetical protein|uniref:Uncharacterized protein n=1 Tax=Thermosporothrix hazakensis TaxID=644383 RepID=A0A326TTY1_THEHA|nr:hypothetical protein [Thermosporothrix hazakensis]PZW19328.1 hypothetical protein EI42_06141 [Thermosporothrix hazakensis]GCE48234.1 hypothetical protein KTH_31030 [Thermosporothrix hazakensis]
MKLNKELAGLYYTAAEARKVLGLDEEAFQYWGRTGRVTRIYLPGRKQAVYSRKEINKIAGKLEAAILAEKLEGLDFRKATINELDAEVELASLVFGSRARQPEAIERRQAFIEHCPNSTYHLYDHGHLVAYFNIFPFNHKAIENFKEGVRGWLLGVENLETFAPGKPLECIIIDFASTPTVPPDKRSNYAQILLENLLKETVEWGKQGIEITKLYAASNTPQGIRIIKHAGFQQVKEVGPGRFTFELDVQNTDSKILLEYKQALKEWKEQPQKKASSKKKQM